MNGGSGNSQEGANSNGVANALTHNGGSGSTMSTSTSANNVMNGNSNGVGGSHGCNGGGLGGDQHSMEDGESHQRGEKEKPRRRNISALSSSGGSNGGEDIDELDDAQSMEYSAGGGLTASLNGDVIIVGDGTATTTNGEAMLKLGRECNGNDVDSNGCCQPPPPTSAVINGGGTGHHLDSRDSLESDKMVASSASSEQESNMSQVSIAISFRSAAYL